MTDSPHPPRIFIIHAPQDAKYCELIATKARQDQLPLAFDSFGEGRADEPNWQRECRRRIHAARAVVVLVSAHIHESARVLWQVGCAREEGVPIVGITVAFEGVEDHTDGSVVDPISVVGWKWKGIAAMLTRLAANEPARPAEPAATGLVGPIEAPVRPTPSPARHSPAA